MTDVASLVQEGLEHHQSGRLQRAAALYLQALERHPAHAEASHLLGLLEHQAGHHDSAVRRLSDAVASDPRNPTYRSNQGVVLQSLGRLHEASACYERAIELDPGISAVHNNHAVVLHGLGRFDEAEAACHRALALEPGYAEAHANLGLTLQALGRLNEAVAAYRRAISLRPRYAKAFGNLGNALRELQQPEQAIESYQAALALQPQEAGLMNNLGLALRDARRPEEALESFHRAISLKPDYAEAWYNLGGMYGGMRHYKAAAESFREALSIRDSAATHFALGLALSEMDEYREAAEAFRRAAEMDPSDGMAQSSYWRSLNQGCDWHDYDARRAGLREIVDAGARPGTTLIPPFHTLSMLDDPAIHRIAAANHASAQRPNVAAGEKVRRQPERPRSAHGRIRLAYLSADFHDHATAYLIAEMFESHDRERFEVHGISFGPKYEGSAIRERLRNGLDAFHDLHGTPARGIAQAVADLDVDIAIDLKGYTKDARTGIFAFRPAPIQVQYLGFPGTMGADFIDYVIADPVVIPEAEQPHYAERIAYLPHSYQVNDRQRPLPAEKPARSACGLPDSGFVFACFNANYKITPEIFSIWMRLLQQVDGSVLWLFEGNDWARENLRAEAAARGVDPNRLVFAGKLSLEKHLARIQNADLFVDTLPYNAHTTASDALWVGLPLITTPGRSFASRVGASLLTAVGMPELIAQSLDRYESLALELARDPARLAALRQRLIDGRRSAPLFDTPAFTRHIEAAYARMWQLHLDGKPPETFHIEAGN